MLKLDDKCFVIVAESFVPKTGTIFSLDGPWIDVKFGDSIVHMPRCYVFSSFSEAVRAMV